MVDRSQPARPVPMVAALALSASLLLAACGEGSDRRAAPQTVSLANLNVLHGFDCDPPTPADGDQCRVRERVALLSDHLVDSGCPDVVTLQEIVNREYVQRSPTEQAGPLDSLVDLLADELPELAAACGFSYEMVYRPFLPAAVAETDEELILSRYPVLESETHPLHSAMYDEAGGFLLFARHVLRARIDHPGGELDVYTTHLSSGSDSANNSCTSFRELIPDSGIGPRVDCPAECDRDDTVRACQARQLALLVEQTRGTDALALISGDFNAVPGSSEYREMTSRGWLDSHLAAGSPECDPQTGEHCSSGRGSSAEAIEDSALNVDQRIDYIFVAPAGHGACQLAAGSSVAGRWQVTDGGLFAGVPNPFAATCGPPPLPPCWVSDHSGNRVAMACRE